MRIARRGSGPFHPIGGRRARTTMDLLRGTHCDILRHRSGPAADGPNTPFVASALRRTTDAHLKFNIGGAVVVTRHLCRTNCVACVHASSAGLDRSTMGVIHNCVDSGFNGGCLPRDPGRCTDGRGSRRTRRTVHPSSIGIVTRSLGSVRTSTRGLCRLV